MTQLLIENPSANLLVQLGDALIKDGAVDAAAGLYRQALAICPPSVRASLISRLGLTTQEPAYARQMLGLLQDVEAQFPNRNAFVASGMATWLKTHSFLDDDRFMSLAEKHQALLPIPNWHWNLNAALWAVWQAKDIPGDFVELGVFKGHTTLFLAEYLEFETQARRWFLYDTFEGIPPDQLNAGWAEMNQQLYGGTYSYEEVRDRFAHIPNIEVIKGRVPEIFDLQCPSQIAFLHLDLNSASAEIAALEYIYDRLSPGGVILLDDYCWQAATEQHIAERAWFATRNLRILELPTGQGVFVKAPSILGV